MDTLTDVQLENVETAITENDNADPGVIFFENCRYCGRIFFCRICQWKPSFARLT